MPINYYGYDGATLLVGKDIAPKYPLKKVAGRPGLFYGLSRDLAELTHIIDYFTAVSDDKLYTFAAPPTVHIGQDLGHRQNVLRAVQLLNEALPPAWHIRIGEDVPPLSEEVPDGLIYIDFGVPSELERWLSEGAAGVAVSTYTGDGSSRSSHIFVAPDNTSWQNESDDTRLDMIVVHELLHSLGFDGHIDRLDSRLYWTILGPWEPTKILYPIDRQALFAAYVKLKAGDTKEAMRQKFQLWLPFSDHFVFQTETSEFGVARQSIFEGDEPSLLQGWASGEAPYVNLADSPLQGEVTWSGDLVGFRPGDTENERGESNATVMGKAQVRVNLSTLQGDALFHQLEVWKYIVRAGSDIRPWGDGDLEYDIEVRGNTFRQSATSTDDGVLTGIFTGKDHEGAAGTLERDDLTAAFGAVR
ncbi:MAG: hypothetical protein OXF11_18270 [Deltaproteobacteria bacterium]|nr:hypothetical protein [Deltaproteobacteria bacterium]